MRNDEMQDNEPLLDGCPSLDGAFEMPDIPDTLRDRIWRETSATVRRRAVARRMRALTLVAASFVAGMATTYGIGAIRPTLPEGHNDGERALKTVDVRVTGNEQLTRYEVLSLRFATATDAERLELLREMGDRLLLESGDIEGALRYYRPALDLYTEEQLRTVGTQDTWLFASLKQARLEGLNHAAPQA